MLNPLWRLALCLWLLGAYLPAQAAPFEDSMAQRTLACADCHGGTGQGRAGVYPALAGNQALPISELQVQTVRDPQQRR